MTQLEFYKSEDRSYITDREWTDTLMPLVHRKVAPYMVKVAPQEEDQKRNTDLIVAYPRVQVHLRTYDVYDSPWRDNFAIRSYRPNTLNTELYKCLVEGYGDAVFRGICNPDKQSLACWLFGDLNVWRPWFWTEIAYGRVPWCDVIRNKSDVTGGLDFELNRLPPEFLIAQEGHL